MADVPMGGILTRGEFGSMESSALVGHFSASYDALFTKGMVSKKWTRALPSKVTGNRDIDNHGTLPSSGFLGGEHLCFLG